MKTWLPVLLVFLLASGVAESAGAPVAVGLLAAALWWWLRRQAAAQQAQQAATQAELLRLRALLGVGALADRPAAPAPAETGPAAAEPVPVAVAPAQALAPEPEPAAAPAPAPTPAPAPATVSARAIPEVDERSPGITTSLGASLRAWVTGGNTIVRLAVLILFAGVAFLLRYAAEHSLVPIELRLAGVAAGAVGLVALGWRLRRSRRGYALSLQGAGVGMLYLVLFAALRLYGLLPPGLAFALLVALALFGALLAVWQDALPLAVLGFAGGFLAPVLTSTGQGSHVVLFSYYGVLNLAIAFIARRKAWKLLNLVGFLFTFGIGLGWGLKAWQPELLWSTEPFLVAHVGLYLWIALQYSRRVAAADGPARPYVDAGLLFGMPLAAMGLQAGMVRHIPYALAVSAAVMSALYLLLGRWLWRHGGERLRLFTEGMLALGVVFLALVAPLALDARWTAAAWALQGAGVAWVALRQHRGWALAMGLLLQGAAALSFWSAPAPAAATPFVLNAVFAGALAMALAALFTGLQLQRRADAWPPAAASRFLPAVTADLLRLLQAGLIAAGVLHLLAGGLQELARRPWLQPDRAQSNVAWLLALALVLELVHRPLRWPPLSVPARPLWALALALSLAESAEAVAGPGAGWARWWPLGLVEAAALAAAGHLLMRRLDRDGTPPRRSLGVEHLAAGWYALLQSALLAYSAMAHFIVRHEAWTVAVVLVGPTAIAWGVLARLRRGQWPASQHPQAWLRGLAAPWLGLLALWCLAVNALADGSMQPLPYLPLLNPVDLGHALAGLYAWRLLRGWREAGAPALPAAPLAGTAAALGFWWLNSLLVRSLHHWAGTPMWWNGALDSGLVQTGLTMLWTLLALATMGYAARRAGPALARPLWLAGAVLLGAVVLKLMLVDLSQTSALQRIVSFLGVGGLMLVIGYVAPLPPARRAAPEAAA